MKFLIFLLGLEYIGSNSRSIWYSLYLTFSLESSWVKVYSHDIAGGTFPKVEDGRKFNEDKPEEYLYSILYRLEEFRMNGGFHIRFCWDYLADRFDFPCNEWFQTSNFAFESNITDFQPLKLTFPESGVGGSFGGLGVSPTNFGQNLIDDLPYHGTWWYSVGTVAGFGPGFPGPHPHITKNAQIYIKTGN